MKRIAIVIPDTKTSENVVEILREEGVSDENIFVLTKQNDQEGSQVWLPAEGAVGAAMLGVGGATLGTLGFLAELPVFVFAGGILVATGAVLRTAVLAAGFVAWLSKELGRPLENKKISEYKTALEEGKIVVIAEVPENRFEIISEGIKDENLNLSVEKV